MRPPDIPPSGPITLAFTGDTTFVDGVSDGDARVRATFDLLRDATLGFTNLEVPLLDAELALRPAAHRPVGRTEHAATLRRLGIDLVSLANNHAMDRDREGLESTTRALSAAGILFAGAGSDLAAAQAPAIVGDARRIALVAVTASAAPATRASASRPDIAGRPGVHPLEYSASITVDAATYATLAQSVRALEAGPPPGERELSLFGTRIVRGDRIQVDVALNRASIEPVLDAVKSLRDSGALVVVSVHSHEPANGSEEPAAFLRDFAHAVADAGARIVVGHGPHRIRGGELYNGAVILYSLGNFVFATGKAGLGEPDPFDSGQDLFRMALGALDGQPPRLEDPLAAEWWWQGLMAVVTLDGDRVTHLRLHPLDLPRTGSGGDVDGHPRLAEGPVGRAILTRFTARWAGTNTPFRLADDGSALELPIP